MDRALVFLIGCGSDLKISSPSAGHCLSPVVRSEKGTSTQSQGAKADTNSVKRSCNSGEPLRLSPRKPVSSTGWSHETCLKPAVFDDVADFEKTNSPVSKSKTNNTLKDAYAVWKRPTISLDSEDDQRSVGSPVLMEEAKISPVHTLHFDDQNNPAAVKSHMDVEKLEGPQTWRDEQVVLQTDHTAASVQREKSVAKGTLGKRLTSATPVKDEDIEIEYECEFLIDESDESFNSWLSIPRKNKKSKKDGSATPVSKSQPPEKKTTESKRGDNRKTQAKSLTKRKMDDLDVGVRDCKGTSELDPVSNSEGKVLKSQRQSSTRMSKTKKGALRQGSPNKEKDMSWKPEAEELTLSRSGLETEAPDAEQCKTRVMSSVDLPVHSTGHQQEQTISPKKNLKSSRCLESALKASQPLACKKQTSKQKPPSGKVAKRLAESPEKQLKKSGKTSSNKKSRLQSGESSDSERDEEGVEREPVKLTEVHEKFQTSVIQKLAESEKPKDVLDTLESLGGASNRTPVKAQQRRVRCVKNTEKKQSSAMSSRKMPKKINLRTSKGVCSNPKDTESQVDSDSSTVQDTARKSQKLSDVKIKQNERQCGVQHILRNKIEVQQGQNVLQLIQDCFECCGSDLKISSPSAGHCLSPVVRSEKGTSTQSQGAKADTNSVKRSCNSGEPLRLSPRKPVSSTGWSHETCLKPAVFDDVADFEKTNSPVSKSKTNNTLKDAYAVWKRPTISLDSEDDQRSVGSPVLMEEAKISPVHTLHFDDQNNPAAVKSHMDVEKLEGPQTWRDEQVVLQTDHTAASVQREKSVAKGTLGKRLTSATPVKDEDIEIEYECEFLIDESDESFNSWLSIPRKNKKSKKDGSATPVSKSQPPEKKTTESKRGDNRKTQAKSLTKRKMDDLDVGVRDCKGTSELDPVSNSEGKVLKSQRQSSTRMSKTKKGALRQGSPNKEKDMSWKPEAEELTLSRSGLETEAPDAEQCKTRVMSSVDLPVHSTGHQQEQTISPKKNLKSSRCLESALKASQPLACKKQTSKQKPPSGKVAKRLAESPEKQLKKSGKTSSNKKSRLQSGESSDSERDEEGVEREPVKLTEVHEKFQTSVIQKLAESEKPKDVLDTLESLGGASNRTPVKAQQRRVRCVKNTEKKQSSAMSSRKMPKKINLRTSKGVCSNPKDTESQVDSDSSTVQDTARKSQKLSDVKIKQNERQCGVQHILRGPVQGCCDELASRSEEVYVSSDSSEDVNYQLKHLLSDHTARHKIVMPSNTPNVRRTKRIRLRPLEYWRGERVNYVMNPSGGLMISGIACPQTEPHRAIKQRKDRHKWKRGETRHEIPVSFYHNLGDASKPSVVLDPKTNQEILLACISTETMNSFFNDESVEVFKSLNTSDFAIGRLVLKPLKEKGHQFVYMDTLAFYVIHGKIILTLHETPYYLTTGDYFYVPAGNRYNLHNLLNEESVLLFTQLKKDP
ncbi:centromere protein C [Phaenicophaeus curvirostris]|uniref:centromere protein C n=1 Tax=Phaenicophaeus curvirostris TaxID=33595 RepID=UPI0037F0E2F4